MAQVAGKPVLRFKAAGLRAVGRRSPGLAGALYGHFTSYIAPDLFLPLITVYIFLAVASGGIGSPAGALVGAYLLMTLLEFGALLRRADSRPSRAVQRAALKELLIAVALILVLRLMPTGAAARTHPARTAPCNRRKLMTPFDSCIAALRSPARPTTLFKAVDQALGRNRRPQAVHASLRGARRQAGEAALHQHAQGISRRRLQAGQRERLAQAGDRPAPRLGRLRLRGHQMGVLRS